MYGYEAADRREDVKISLKLDKSAHDRHEPALRALRLHVGTVREGDTLMVRYEFGVSYYGNVVRKLEAINSIIADEKIVCEVDVEELRHGRSVILELTSKLTRLIDKMEGKQCPTPSKRSWWQRRRGSSLAGS